jgi:crotonobetainyl-CoA:carnitine CoA-transferase CaiB-like acyl-CoA transferase
MDAKGPLAGLRVLDLSTVVLGPMTGQYLGDMGAEVIKIESPEGDVTRAIGPRRNDGMGALFLANNRNKRSVVLDLKADTDRAHLRAMVGQVDVVLHSIRTDSAARLGIGYSDLAALNPRLIYCHLKGFSDEGRYAGKAAYDDVVQALSSLAMLQTVVGGEPRYVPSIIADKISAVHAAWAIALALFHRERTGRGQAVTVPMLETMFAFNMMEHLGGQIFSPAVGDMGYKPVREALRRPFRTADGHLCFLPYTDANWRTFLTLIERPDLLADPVFATQKGRQANLDRVWGEVATVFTSRSTKDWLDLFEGSDIPYASVNALEDLLEDPHLKDIGFWQLHDHPTEGRMRFPAPPIGLSASPAAIWRLPPCLGEHTQEVLREFGLTVPEA